MFFFFLFSSFFLSRTKSGSGSGSGSGSWSGSGSGSESGSASGSGSSGSSSGIPGCTTDEVTAPTECFQKLTDEMTKTPPTKDNICKTYQDYYACYPSCFCDDATNKDMIDTTEKSMNDAVKAMDGGECTLTCGSDSGSGRGSGSGSGSGSSSGSGEPTMCSIMASMSSDPDKCQGPCMGGASKSAICEF